MIDDYKMSIKNQKHKIQNKTVKIIHSQARNKE